MGCGGGLVACIARRLRFWTVAVSKNSFRAPLRPRSLRRTSERICLAAARGMRIGNDGRRQARRRGASMIDWEPLQGAPTGAHEPGVASLDAAPLDAAPPLFEANSRCRKLAFSLREGQAPQPSATGMRVNVG